MTAAAAPGSTFQGWSGGVCSGTGTCSVTMTAAASVTADFATIATGRVILAVVISEDDGLVSFSSSAAPLVMTLVTSGGVAQSPPVTLNAGTCSVTAAPPGSFDSTAQQASVTALLLHGQFDQRQAADPR